MYAKRPTQIKEFDIFVKKRKEGWKFETRIEADSQAHAKRMFLMNNHGYYDSHVTAYPHG